MKSVYTFFTFILAALSPAFGQTWTQLNSPAGSPMGSISFWDCQHGAASGGNDGNGHVQTTVTFTPDGTHWALSSVPPISVSYINALQFVSPTKVYCTTTSGIDGRFVFSNDGGQTFSDSAFPILGGPGAYQYFVPACMAFLDSLTGYLGGEYYTQSACNCHSWQILKTQDGGKTWEQSAQNYPNRQNQTIESISFPDRNHGFALSDYDTLFATSDSGHTWTMKYQFSSSLSVNAIFFQSPTNGWATCGGGHLLKTTDGGASWTEVVTFANYGYGKVIFTSATDMWLLGGGLITHNKNGGSNFLTQTETFSISGISDFCMLNTSQGYAIAGDGSIYQYFGPLDTTHITRSVCSGQSVIVNGQSFNETGNYNITLVGSGGCDSAEVNLSLTVNPSLNPIISDNGGVLSTGSYSSYQWLYGVSPLAGDTLQSLTPPLIGSYSVVVSNGNGCFDTSAALSVTTVDIHSISSDEFSISPIPAKDYIRVFSSSVLEGLLTIRDVTGKEMKVVKMQSNETMVDLSGFSVGVYILTIQNGGDVFVRKIIKE